MEDIFTVQDEIAENIAANLKVKLISKRVRGVQSRQNPKHRFIRFLPAGEAVLLPVQPQSVTRAMVLFRKSHQYRPGLMLWYTADLANC